MNTGPGDTDGEGDAGAARTEAADAARAHSNARREERCRFMVAARVGGCISSEFARLSAPESHR
jgi:hypothetical protein